MGKTHEYSMINFFSCRKAVKTHRSFPDFCSWRSISSGEISVPAVDKFNSVSKMCCDSSLLTVGTRMAAIPHTQA